MIPLDLRVVDGLDNTATTWNGHVRVRARGGVRVRAYTEAGEVLVTRGEGRVYVQVDPSNVHPAVTAEAEGLQGAELVLGASP